MENKKQDTLTLYYRGKDRKLGFIDSDLLPLVRELNHAFGWKILNEVHVYNFDTGMKLREEEYVESTHLLAASHKARKSYMMCTSDGLPMGVITKFIAEEKKAFRFTAPTKLQDWRKQDTNNYIESVNFNKLVKNIKKKMDNEEYEIYNGSVEDFFDANEVISHVSLATRLIEGADESPNKRHTAIDSDLGKKVIDTLLNKDKAKVSLTSQELKELKAQLEAQLFSESIQQKMKDNSEYLMSKEFWIIGKDYSCRDVHLIGKAKLKCASENPKTPHDILLFSDSIKGYLDINEHKDRDKIIPKLTLWSIERESIMEGMNDYDKDRCLCSYTLQQFRYYNESLSLVATHTNNKICQQQWIILFDDKE